MTTTTTAGVRPADITAALHRLYPSAKIRCTGQADGTAIVRMPALWARYLGACRDDTLASAWISAYAPYGVLACYYGTAGGGDVLLTVARAAGRPPHPGGSAGVPSYATPAEVTGDWPANTRVASLIKLAIEAGCRPHVAPERSPHGHRYRVGLWHVNPELLHGVIDVTETSGRFAAAWWSWGRGPEQHTADLAVIRTQLTSARDLHHGGRRLLRAGPRLCRRCGAPTPVAAPGPGPGRQGDPRRPRRRPRPRLLIAGRRRPAA